MEYDMASPTKILSNGDKSGNMYEIREDLNNSAKIIIEKGLLFYLCVDKEETLLVDTIHNNNDEILIEKTVENLILVPEHLLKNTNAAIPVVRIISDKGGFVIDSTYQPPITKITKDCQLYQILEKFIKFLRDRAIEMAAGFFTKNPNDDEATIMEKINYSLQYNSIMPETLVLESLLYNQQHPFNVFLSLQKIIGGLSLLRFTNLPSLQIYNHYDLFASIQNLISIITTMINSLKIDGERIQLEYEEGKFYIQLPIQVFLPSNKTYLLLEMDNENEMDKVTTWIEDARICGGSSEELVNSKRVRGVERKIFPSLLFGNKVLLVELNMQSEYIKPSDGTLYIYNTFSDYLPRSIVLCWRNGSFE
jgi:predicted component of type VI protein secretion system